MKKVIISLICILFAIGFIFSSNENKTSAKVNDKLIRFHVIANSDSDSDQSTKLKVRDAILKEIGSELSKSKSVEESLKIIEKDKTKIENISNKILKKEGKNYTAKAMIGEFSFPVKSYGTITLPAGEYTALRVVLGKGDGKNWWCVMFPPLCFIDVTRGLTSEETDDQLKKVMDNEEIKSITAFKQEDTKQEIVLNSPKSSGAEKTYKASAQAYEDKKDADFKSDLNASKVEFRFKSVEIFKNVMKKIEQLFD